MENKIYILLAAPENNVTGLRDSVVLALGLDSGIQILEKSKRTNLSAWFCP